jgi:hypothetical protein
MQQEFNYDVISGVDSNGNPKNILVDSGGSVSVSPGLAYESTATITRAANTTAYTANDVYGTVFELANIGPSGGFVFLKLRYNFQYYSTSIGYGCFCCVSIQCYASKCNHG